MARKRSVLKWERRRTEIVDEAARLFAERGYHATGVAELSETVGLGRGALYYYIDSKEKLLGLIHDRVMTYVLASGERALALDGTARARLEQLGRDLVGIITRYPDHVWVFLHEFRSLTGDEATTFRASRRKYEHVIETILQQGIDNGEFRIANPRLTALGWLGLHNYVYIWFREGGSFTPELIAEQFATAFLDGICTRD